MKEEERSEKGEAGKGPVVYTIGFTKKSLEEFVRRLQAAGVDALIDIRLRPGSQLAGFAKQDDLAFIMRAFLGIAYEHQPDLAPTTDILDTYRKEKDWDAYVRQFEPLIRQRGVEQLGREITGRYQTPCLLCSEDTAEQCHRRLVAEYWQEHIPGLTIIHL